MSLNIDDFMDLSEYKGVDFMKRSELRIEFSSGTRSLGGYKGYLTKQAFEDVIIRTIMSEIHALMNDKLSNVAMRTKQMIDTAVVDVAAWKTGRMRTTLQNSIYIRNTNPWMLEDAVLNPNYELDEVMTHNPLNPGFTYPLFDAELVVDLDAFFSTVSYARKQTVDGMGRDFYYKPSTPGTKPMDIAFIFSILRGFLADAIIEVLLTQGLAMSDYDLVRQQVQERIRRTERKIIDEVKRLEALE